MTDSANSSQDLRIGPYNVIGAIPDGSVWGDMVQAMDEEQSRYVALLFLSPSKLSPPGALERIEKVAQSLYQLDHENTVRYYDFINEDQKPFLVKEYCGETSLQAMITQGDLPPMPVLAHFIVRACRGLHAGWQLSLNHGALTPAQLLISPAGILKVNEIGLLQALCGPSDPDGAVAALGNAALYAAPERMEGGPFDWQADLYALGAVFYHVLAGEPPFDGKTDREARLAPLTPLPELNKSVPPDLWQVINQMMAPDPSARYSSFGQVISALKKAGAETMDEAYTDDDVAPVQEPDVSEPAPYEPIEDEEPMRSPLTRHSISEYMDPSRVDIPTTVASTRRPTSSRHLYAMMIAFLLICIAVGLTLWGRSEGPTDKQAFAYKIHNLLAKIIGGKETDVQTQRQKRTMTRDNMLLIDAATQEYFIDERRYPDSVQALVDGGYMKAADSVDGWGTPFLCNLAKRTIRSFGADNEEGTTDDFVLVDGEFTQEPTKDDMELLDEDY